ncbi:MAG: agmatinase [Candidatus Micrarchaeaceae archaeon]
MKFMLLNSLPPYNLFGLEDQSYEKSKVVVLPVPYDSTTTYKSGTREGPRAIIEASRSIELYLYETKSNPSELGIFTTEELEPDFSSPEKTIERVKKEVYSIMSSKKFPVVLGGEHTISIGSVKAAKEIEEMSVIYFDAHSDCRNELFGSRYMHGTVARRIRELGVECIEVGVRSFDDGSNEFADEIISIDELKSDFDGCISKALRNTKSSIYISFDFDVFDTSIMPCVGTPEPHGLLYKEALEIMKKIEEEKKVIGMDFVEYLPIPGFHAPAVTAAKFIYTCIGLFVRA